MYGIGIAKGLLVTLKNLFRTPSTVQYPEERAEQHSRFRGQEFSWYEERCTGCASCAKYCPLGIIEKVDEIGKMMRAGVIAAVDQAGIRADKLQQPNRQRQFVVV